MNKFLNIAQPVAIFLGLVMFIACYKMGLNSHAILNLIFVLVNVFFYTRRLS